MLDKEMTYFLIDTSPMMGRIGTGRSVTDFNFCLEYMKRHCAHTLTKDRKTDRIGVITFDGYLPPAQRINTVLVDGFLTYIQFKQLMAQLVVHADAFSLSSVPKDSDGPTLASALKATVGKFAASKKLKYTRSLVVLSNFETVGIASSRQDEVLEIISGSEESGITIITSIVDYTNVAHSPSKESNLFCWRVLSDKVSSMQIYDSHALNCASLYSPSLNKISSRPLFTGKLCFGAKGLRIDTCSANSINSLENPIDSSSFLNFNDSSYSHNSTDSWISTDVQSFPACCTLSRHILHDYRVSKSKMISCAKRNQKYYVKQYKVSKASSDTSIRMDWYNDETDSTYYPEYEMIPVSRHDCVRGFRYSHDDVIALKPDVLDMARLKCNAGMDIMGFLERKEFLYALMVANSQYVLPSYNALPGSKLVFNLLCKAMLELECVAITRYVPMPNAEIQVVVLMPYQFDIGGKFAWGFTSTRLASKEEENCGTFMPLTESGTLEDAVSDEGLISLAKYTGHVSVPNIPLQPQTLPSTAIDLMDQFVMAKTIHEPDYKVDPCTILSNPKLAIQQQPLRLPYNRSKLYLCLHSCSPSVSKFSNHLTSIISQSVQESDLYDFMQTPHFVEKYLLDKQNPNLYNFSNILAYNTPRYAKTILKQINRDAIPIAKQLIQELDCVYRLHNTNGRKTQKDKSISMDLVSSPVTKFDSFVKFNELTQ